MSGRRIDGVAQCRVAAVPAQLFASGLVLALGGAEWGAEGALRGNVSNDADDDPLRNRRNGVEN